MKLFGAGVFYITPTIDAFGNTIAVPQPTPVGILQDVSLNFEFTNKPLYGALQFPVAIGRGEGKCTGTAKFANIYSLLWNNAFFGQPAATVAGFIGIVTSTVAVAIPATPFQITPTVPSAGTWDTDESVTDSNGNLMIKVASGPTAGQYSVAAGVYTFASADNVSGLSVFINFRYTATVTGATKTTVANLLMGYAPQIQIDLQVSYAGKSMFIRLPGAIPSKFTWAFKNTDWTIPNFDFDCFADTSNNIVYTSMSGG